jgi:hypothetical protein
MSTTSFPVGGGGLASKILNSPTGPYNPPPNTIVPGSICPGVDTNQLGGVTVEAVIPIGAFGVGDVPVILPQNCRKILLSSIGGTLGQGEEAFGLQIHFAPLGIDYSTSYVNQGTEKWIQIHNGEVQTVTYLEGLIIEFRSPISRFLMDIQGSAGHTSVITWICADDICDITWKPQPSTNG